MNFFKKRIKKKRKRQRSTEEQKLDKAKLRRERYIEDALVEMAEQNPALKRQLVADTFGFKLPDPAEERKRELKAVIDDLVIRRIGDEPELARKIADAKLHQIMSEEGITTGSEEGSNRPSPMRQLITRAKEIAELKELMGIKEPGFWDAVSKPEVLKGIFSLIPPIVSLISGGKDISNTGEETVSVQINGEMKQITMSEFEKLKKDGRIKLVGAEEPPKSDGG